MDAQKAYYDLNLTAAEDYDHLKVETLARADVTTAVRAQNDHVWGFSSTVAPHSQMFDLIHLAHRWLNSDVNSTHKVMEIIVMDRYLLAMPAHAKKVGESR